MPCSNSSISAADVHRPTSTFGRIGAKLTISEKKVIVDTGTTALEAVRNLPKDLEITVAFVRYAGPEQVHVLVTEGGLSSADRKHLEERGINILFTEEE